MTELDEMAHRLADRRSVVDADRGGGVGIGCSIERDGGESEFVQQRGAWVVDSQVGDEDAVHPAGSCQFAIGLLLRRLVGDEADQQENSGRGDGRLDAGDEGREERVGPEGVVRAGHHQAEIPGPAEGQRPRRRVRSEAKLFRNLQHPVAGVLGHPGPSVQGERDGRLRHPGARGDVGDRGLRRHLVVLSRPCRALNKPV